VARAKRMKERAMRRVFCLAIMVATASPALAADLDVLRGSEPAAPVVTVGPATFTRWSGLYFGGDVGVTNANVDFTSATAPLITLALQGTLVEQVFTPSQLAAVGRGASTTLGGGAFLGYNTQWQDLILGVEANYTHTNLRTTATSTTSSGVIARSFGSPVGNVTAIAISNPAAHMNVTDYGEARFRAGYVVGNLLPYGFAGFVVGSGDYSASVKVDLTCTNGVITGECVGYPLFPSAGQNNTLLWGFSVGFGLDWALTQNFFLRGEFEFVQFAPVDSINVPIVSGRVGAGYKF
jgi:outer membrane immunogenic protein